MKGDRSNRFQYRSLFTPTVLILLLMGVSLHIFGFLGIEVFWGPLSEPELPGSFIQLEPMGQSMEGRAEQEFALLNDSAPLFIPTRWNYLSRSEFAGYTLPENEPLFRRFPSRVREDPYQYEITDHFPEPDPRGVDAMLDFETTRFFEGIGQKDSGSWALEPRRAYFSILSLNRGEISLSGTIDASALSPVLESDWKPLEILFVVDSLGVAGRPYTVVSSGNEEVDATILQWFLESRPWAELGAGYYRLKIGP
jgi:hypothetical protein